ncbi:sulfatase family protein [Paraglaciecola sp.]|uniref:sulfatase family protein n=1 Tax=Paraglaciecola sp. TaxID=1920173 RepID=UPI003EF44F47
MNKIGLLLFLIAFSLPSYSTDNRPNILLIMAEDMSARVGAFDDPVAVTPHIDALAEVGIRYPNTFTTAGVCAPSRTSQILGMHQISVGGQHMRTRDFKASKYLAVPPAKVKAYPELLRQAGYFTYTNSKLDYQFSEYATHSGPFTIWDEESRKAHWRQGPKNTPFFGFVTLEVTHESRLFTKKAAQNRKRKGWSEPVKATDVAVPPFLPDSKEVRQDLTQHYNNIHNMDKQVGQLIAQLKEDGLYENTIILWTTDHGDALPRAKREIYDSGIKVPLIVVWPQDLKPKNLKPSAINSELISFVDFAPSILTMASVNIPDYIQGKSYLIDQSLKPRKYVFASKDRIDGFPFRERAVRDHKFKYIKNYMPEQPGGVHIAYRDQLASMQSMWKLLEQGKLNKQQEFWFTSRPADELYDITQDPFELNNLAAQTKYQKQLVTMRQALSDWQSKVADLSEQDELSMAKAMWPKGQQPVTQAPNVSITKGQMVVTNSTADASVGYKVGTGKWQLYHQPVSVKPEEKVQVKAVKYGWAESEVVMVNH